MSKGGLRNGERRGPPIKTSELWITFEATPISTPQFSILAAGTSKGAFFMRPQLQPQKVGSPGSTRGAWKATARVSLAVLPNRHSVPFDTFWALDATKHDQRGSSTIV